MGILSGIIKSKDKPITDSTVGGAYRFFFSSATTGKVVTERSTMQMTADFSKESERSNEV